MNYSTLLPHKLHRAVLCPRCLPPPLRQPRQLPFEPLHVPLRHQPESTHPGPPFKRIARLHAVRQARHERQHHCPAAHVEQHLRAHIGWETEGCQCPVTRCPRHWFIHTLRLQATLPIAKRVLQPVELVTITLVGIIEVYRERSDVMNCGSCPSSWS